MINFLPLIIGDLVPKSNSSWNLLKLLREILDILHSPIVTENATYHLTHLIADHHSLYMKLSKSELKPKHHHVSHYPRLIRMIGPIWRYSTMRYKAKHRFFKTISKLCCNFKNIAKTVSTRHQLSRAYQIGSKKIFHKFSCILQKQVVVPISLTKYSDLISTLLQCPGTQEILTGTSMTVNEAEFSPGSLAVVNWTESGPEVVKIMINLFYNGVAMAVVQTLELDQFNSHYQAYSIKPCFQSSFYTYYYNNACFPTAVLSNQSFSTTDQKEYVVIPFTCS